MRGVQTEKIKTNSKLEVKDEYINKYADDSIARDRIKETWYYDEYADNYKGKEIQPKKETTTIIK